MNKHFLVALCGLLMGLCPVMAEFKYSFVDLDYTYTHYDAEDVKGGNGVRVGLSISPMEYFFIKAGLGASKADSDFRDWDVQATRFNLGIGGYLDPVSWCNLVGEVGIIYDDVDTEFESIENSELGVYAKPGVQFATLGILELKANIYFSTIDNEEFGVGLGAGVNVLEYLQIKAGVDFAGEENIFSAGLRAQW